MYLQLKQMNIIQHNVQNTNRYPNPERITCCIQVNKKTKSLYSNNRKYTFVYFFKQSDKLYLLQNIFKQYVFETTRTIILYASY